MRGGDMSVMEISKESPWMTAEQAAQYLKIHVDTVHRLAAQGKLRRHGSRRMYRFLKEDLDEYLKSKDEL